MNRDGSVQLLPRRESFRHAILKPSAAAELLARHAHGCRVDEAINAEVIDPWKIGGFLDCLFESVYYLRPIAEFREEVSQSLPKREARQLIEHCKTKCAPRVSFETAETKTT
jgi:hypothetical protein